MRTIYSEIIVYVKRTVVLSAASRIQNLQCIVMAAEVAVIRVDTFSDFHASILGQSGYNNFSFIALSLKLFRITIFFTYYVKKNMIRNLYFLVTIYGSYTLNIRSEKDENNKVKPNGHYRRKLAFRIRH